MAGRFWGVFFMSEDAVAMEIKATARLEGVKVAVVGDRVYDASQLVPGIVHFTRREYLFLQHYRLGVTLGDAASKAGMGVDEAERFLGRSKTVEWLRDRAVKDHIRGEWAEGGKWWEMGEKCLNGERRLSKDQQVVFMAFGERVCPKPRAEQEGARTVVNFNFSPESVLEAFRRQEIIEAEVGGGGAL